MISKKDFRSAQARTTACMEKAGIVLTPMEKKSIEVVDFGLGRLEELGLEIVVYVNTRRCCAKELALFPGQICAEHRHPPVEGEPGKEETFRCRWGEVYLYVPGPAARRPKGRVPADKKSAFTVWHEVILRPGQQYTLEPDTLHWFQGGPEGAIVSEFSTKSRDESDVFTDPEIKRATVVK
ncbi:MAG TPA: D-lyxose/D-mannose family sugar isomerase [Candidatus Brocadiia bacterium]|nr:D-lyxose/D-mannose family sugar isomerase [Candidatus Brocadiia bacterium]